MKFMGYKRPDGTVGVAIIFLSSPRWYARTMSPVRSRKWFPELLSLCTATAAVSLVRTGADAEDFRWHSEES